MEKPLLEWHQYRLAADNSVKAHLHGLLSWAEQTIRSAGWSIFTGFYWNKRKKPVPQSVLNTDPKTWNKKESMIYYSIYITENSISRSSSGKMLFDHLVGHRFFSSIPEKGIKQCHWPTGSRFSVSQRKL